MTHHWIGRLLLISLLAPAPAAYGQPPSRGGHSESTRESWQKVEDIFAAMAVKPGAVVADVGAGDGFFTSRLAKAIGPGGQVFAVDIGASVLDRLRARVADENLANVKVIEGTPDDPRLPARSVDAILIVNAYHEMAEYPAMLARMKAALKPDGRLVIVEPIAESRRGQPRASQTRNHEISPEFVKEDLEAAGFSQVSFQDPFTARPSDRAQEWMLVATPATPAHTSASLWSASKTREWQDPALRIGMDQYLRRRDAGEDILLLDVRDAASFKDGHMPGAVLMTVEQITSAEGMNRLKGETRSIVAYCSCESEQSSARVAIILRDAGITRVHALVGGYEEWRKRAGR